MLVGRLGWGSMLLPPFVHLMTSRPDVAAMLVRRLERVRRGHSGLFALWEGYVGSDLVVVSICDRCESAWLVHVPHMVHLYRSGAAILVDVVQSVDERLKEGDIVVIEESRHYFCPSALPAEADVPDELAFRPARLQDWLAAQPQQSDAALVAALTADSTTVLARRATAAGMPKVRAGSHDEPLRGWRAREFVRRRFDVSVVDSASYGFLSGASSAGLPAVALALVTEFYGRGVSPSHRQPPRHLLSILADTAVASLRTVRGILGQTSELV